MTAGPGRKLRHWARVFRILADYLDDAGELFDRLDLDLSTIIARASGNGATGPTKPAGPWRSD